MLKHTDYCAGVTCIDAQYVSEGVACFYLLQRDGDCAVIETGTSHSVASLLELMQRRGIDPGQVRYVIPTHVHLDHAGGAGLMMAHLPRAELLVHPRGARHLIDPARLVASAKSVYGEARFDALYGEITPVPAARVRAMGDGDRVELGGSHLLFRHTRGHADHHFCLWDEASRGWFSGDMFGISYPWFRFAGGDYLMPATTPTQFDPEAFLASLALLDSYQPRRMFLTHFGELPYSADRYRLLAEQLASYPDLALGCRTSGESLRDVLARYSLERAREYAPASLPDSVLAEQLAFDVALNAQGLDVWLQREAA